MANDMLSMEQMAAVLDNVPTAVFVSEIEGGKLLYTNRLTRELFPKAGEKGAACYTVAGFDKPCPFCRAGKINRSELMVREYLHPQTKRIYQLSGKLIDWEGKPAHIEYILDVTQKRQEENELKESEQSMLTIFDSISCGLCVYEFRQGQILPIFHNKVFFDVLGYSQEHIRAVKQRTEYLNVHPDDVTPLRKKIDQFVQSGGILQTTYRVWHDKKQEYRFIHLEATLRTADEGKTLMYGVYSDVSQQKRLEKELTNAYAKIEGIVNAIPGGVAIYRVSDIFETVYFSDGVPELSGYTVKEYKELIKKDAATLTYHEDTEMVVRKLRSALETHSTAAFEFRKQHRDGHIVWVHIHAKQIGEEKGQPLLQCVFHNITDLVETRGELNHLVNSIPGGIASYRMEGTRFIPLFFSDGVPALSGHTQEEYAKLMGDNAFDRVYFQDHQRLFSAIDSAMTSGAVLDISYRVYHKNGNLVWLHLNGRRMGPNQFYAVFTNILTDTSVMTNDTVDGVYIINKENYDLLYISETKQLAAKGAARLGQTCYAALHRKSAPCENCMLKTFGPDDQEHILEIEEENLTYTVRTKETVWNGIPAYIQSIRDVTEETKVRREKERMEMYFQTLIKNLPGGIVVICRTPDGKMTPEYISEGFASMTQMTVTEAETLYKGDVFRGVHPDDVMVNRQKLEEFLLSDEDHGEITARFKKGDGSYIWVKDRISILDGRDGIRRLYCVYTDISQLVEEQEQLRRQYEDLIIQHYRTPGPDTLLLGHCNITQKRILEIWDSTQSDLLNTFGRDRDAFFSGIAGLIVDQEQQKAFLSTFLNEPALDAFNRKDTEQLQICLVKFPKDDFLRYVQFKVNMVVTPDTGDITGILSVTDVTDLTVSKQILHQLSVTSHDYVIDLDLRNDTYKLLTFNENATRIPKQHGRHSERVAFMASSAVVPKDRDAYFHALQSDEIKRRLEASGPYTIAYSIEDEDGMIRTKTMTVSAINTRLQRFSLVCTDVTSSVREQQNFLSILAYTFELAAMINVASNNFIMYNRQIVLENLTPYVGDNYAAAQERFISSYVAENQADARKQFSMETILTRLGETPGGYEFILPYKGKDGGLRYKQINVLWGNQSHETVCLVRADVTEMLMAERKAKSRLERALISAEEANRAKSDFFSAMSHDIRTPMNAIMGMTALAPAHLDDRAWMTDCLQKISISSKHLLSLINDVLDMSQIERSKIILNRVPLSIPEVMKHLSLMMGPQAETAGLELSIRTEELIHPDFYGDSLRINQILINLLSNAVKFTARGGKVGCTVKEIPAVGEGVNRVRYLFTISDTGKGMPKDFLKKIFDPFIRDDSVTRIEGSGLGLSIVRGLLDLMRGDISVESEQGKGTTFRVELEFDAAMKKNHLDSELQKACAEPSKKTLFSGRRFLIAEDNALNAEILSDLLDMHGAQSAVASDGLEAVQAFKNSAPGTYDAILMDIQMPRMNGYEAARAIRALARPDAAAIPIIALTANAFAEDIKTASAAGMTGHVSKPIDVDVLQVMLSKVLS